MKIALGMGIEGLEALQYWNRRSRLSNCKVMVISLGEENKYVCVMERKPRHLEGMERQIKARNDSRAAIIAR